MPTVSSFSKEAYEKFPIDIYFGDNMTSAETIASQTITAVDSAGSDVTSSILSGATNDGYQKAIVTVAAGSSSASPYTITFQIITSEANQWQKDIEMTVT